MPPKVKKDPNALIPIPEDAYNRVKKLFELKSAPKDPKAEFTSEEWCIAPAIHTLPEFKVPIHYWQQSAVVHYTEKDLRAPSRMKYVEDDEKAAKKKVIRKEIMDLQKYIKSQVKQAGKRTKQFMKQMTKKETKEVKRNNLVKQISDVDTVMNEELQRAREFVDKQALFDKRYMSGSKLGDKAPRKNALILIEQSDKQAAWVDETKDEITKFLNGVVMEGACETFNMAVFNGSAVTPWCPQFQSKTDPKKGLADSLKWLNKNFSAKTCSPQAFPPNWVQALDRFTSEGQQAPWHIYICCSRSPDGTSTEVLSQLKELRANMGEPAKGLPVLPINAVQFDPTVVGDDPEKYFFDELAGPNGSSMTDTSAEDLSNLDKMLKEVGKKKKQLDKLNKKLDKMEDLSEKVNEDRNLFLMQVALQNMLQSDYDVFEWALKNEVQAEPPAI